MTADERGKERKPNIPTVESIVVRSKDGKFVIHRTIITDIRPVLYYAKVVGEEVSE